MSEGIPYADIIILALIAGFILLRLRGVLGQKRGSDMPDFLRRMQPMSDANEPVVRLVDKTLKPVKPKEETDAYLAALSDEKLKSDLQAIKAKDPLFNVTRFLDGARLAFEMTLESFAKGEKTPLQMLLAEPLYADLEKEIDVRAAQETKTETTLVSIDSKDIARATLTGSLARVGVKFISEQVQVVRNKKGEIIEGNPSDTHRVEDEWLFERDLTSKNPNWKIIET